MIPALAISSKLFPVVLHHNQYYNLKLLDYEICSVKLPPRPTLTIVYSGLISKVT